MEEFTIRPIARIRSEFVEKFGIPRQSGLAPAAKARVVFEPEFRSAEAVRGLEEVSHIWLLWRFSEAKLEKWSPTVRPPRLGGNRRLGVFATRSPFRPNSLGLSAVRLERVELQTPEGPVLYVAGADLLDGTPIFDIKPYLRYADAIPEAVGGFADRAEEALLEVELPPELAARLEPEQLAALRQILARDPRPAYQEDPDRVYGLRYGAWNVRFTVRDGTVFVSDAEENENGRKQR